MSLWTRVFLRRHHRHCAATRTAEARRELQRITDERRNSFEIIDFRKRRAAALKGKTRLRVT